MLHLETLLEHLVDDLLRAIRSASLDELRDILGGETPARRNGAATSPTGARRARRKPVGKPTGPGPSASSSSPRHPRSAKATPRSATKSEAKPASTPASKRTPKPATRSVPKPASRLTPQHAPKASLREPQLAEITDPERLLAGPAKVVADHDTKHLAEGEPPSSAVHPVVDTGPRLQLGETLARSHGSGVVIRRAKTP
jgi:hypothetical protein